MLCALADLGGCRLVGAVRRSSIIVILCSVTVALSTLTAEMRFLRTLDAENAWHRANDAWVTALLPAGSLIRVKRATPLMLWILKTYECAALCWPAEQVEVNERLDGSGR